MEEKDKKEFICPTPGCESKTCRKSNIFGAKAIASADSAQNNLCRCDECMAVVVDPNAYSRPQN